MTLVGTGLAPDESKGTAQDAAALEGMVESTNEQLRTLVEASGLQPAVALTIFNRGLAVGSTCSESQWKAYLAEPGSERFQELPRALLEHAVQQFGLLGGHRADSV